MQKPQHILVIANDDTTRNLLEQFFIIRHIKVVATRTFQQAASIIDLWGLEPFNLAVIDTASFGHGEFKQKSVACHMLREWSMKYPILPILFLGTPCHKRALLQIRADIVQFVVKPFDLDTFVNTINALYPKLHPSELNLPQQPSKPVARPPLQSIFCPSQTPFEPCAARWPFLTRASIPPAAERRHALG